MKRSGVTAFLLLLLSTVACSPPSPTVASTAASGGPASTATTGSTDMPTSEPAPTTITGRTATILSLEGELTFPDTEAPDDQLTPGDQIPVGETICTGANGALVIELDDGSAMVVSANSCLTLRELSGTPTIPITRFFLGLGEIFAFRLGLPALPGDAHLEVETPKAIMGIRGSSLSLQYDDSTGVTTGVCLSGTCDMESTVSGERVGMEGGSRVEIDDAGQLGAIETATPEELQRGADALEKAQEAGSLPDVSPDEVFPTPAPTSTAALISTPTPEVGTGTQQPVGSGPGEVFLTWRCGDTYTVPSGQPITLIYGEWFAVDDAYAARAFTDLSITLTVDGEAIAGEYGPIVLATSLPCLEADPQYPDIRGNLGNVPGIPQPIAPPLSGHEVAIYKIAELDTLSPDRHTITVAYAGDIRDGWDYTDDGHDDPDDIGGSPTDPFWTETFALVVE